MGRTSSRKKKGSAPQHPSSQTPKETSTPTSSVPSSATASVPLPKANGVNGGVVVDYEMFLRKAHEQKEEGNTCFASKEYLLALQHYENALRLTPKMHPDRAVFHSNRAACLMQMKPVDYEAVVNECSQALVVQPKFGRALLRRARAYEGLGKLDLAGNDVNVLLSIDGEHKDGLEIARRLRCGGSGGGQVESRPSPAALGASAVRGAPIAGLGPCLPARPVPKKGSASTTPSGSGSVNVNVKALTQPQTNQGLVGENVNEGRVSPNAKSFPAQRVVSKGLSLKPMSNSAKESAEGVLVEAALRVGGGNGGGGKSLGAVVAATSVRSMRPMKLVYGHDIRLAQMPVKCSFKELREIVGKRFPSSSSVLIKYKDNDGDLVTITSSGELRMAEYSVDNVIEELDDEKKVVFGMLRLHIVEVSPEQEPPLVEEEEEEEEKVVDDEGIKRDESDTVLEVVDTEIIKSEVVPKEKVEGTEEAEVKEVEIDDWLFEFAQLFRSHVGIDPDAHIDLHELGMELCSEALEETVTSEEAQGLFDMAASKFQEVAALAFFNWGNVHMCAARKRIPLDDSAPKDVMSVQLQGAYDWVKDKYTLAGEKYEQALRIKPDFYEGLLALGQQHFETAKLQWSFALANKIDLSGWDSTETIMLFNSAENKMMAATEMWEKLEEQRANELKDPNFKKDELLKRRKKQGDSDSAQTNATSPDELVEQANVMRSQIHLFFGNMLFERSQVEFKLGLDGWEKRLDDAVKRFKLAGASEADISTVLKNHSSVANLMEAEKKNGETLATDVAVKDDVVVKENGEA